MSFGSTAQGFIPKTEDIIIAELEAKARTDEFFGADVDLSIYSPIGIFIRLIAYTVSQNWEALESNYYNSFIDTCEGINIDRLGALVGIQRKQAQPETVILNFTGSEYTIIPIGFLVQSPSGILYKTIESKTITAGIANVQSAASEVGTVSRVTTEQLTEIVSPIAGIDSVTNNLESSGGSLLESDADYKYRILDSVGFVKNSGAVDYIRIKMENESTIQSVFISENNKPIEYNGQPANSLAFTVLGGTDAKVAELIYKYKPAGVQTIGTVTQSVATGFGDSIDVNFSRPSYLDIYCIMNVETTSGWELDNVTKLKTAIIKYIGGVDTIPPDVFEYKGLNIGQDVIAWKSYSYMRDIQGILNLEILFGTNPLAINQSGISVPVNQIAKIKTADINVVIL